MREELEKIGSQERHMFTAVFERFGQKHGYKGPEQTVLFKKVRDESGKVVADHLWFNLTKGFAQLDLKEGDVVSFCGRVEEYERGYYGRREDVYVPTSYDFHITRPTQVKKINNEQDGRV